MLTTCLWSHLSEKTERCSMLRDKALITLSPFPPYETQKVLPQTWYEQDHKLHIWWLRRFKYLQCLGCRCIKILSWCFLHISSLLKYEHCSHYNKFQLHLVFLSLLWIMCLHGKNFFKIHPFDIRVLKHHRVIILWLCYMHSFRLVTKSSELQTIIIANQVQNCKWAKSFKIEWLKL